MTLLLLLRRSLAPGSGQSAPVDLSLKRWPVGDLDVGDGYTITIRVTDDEGHLRASDLRVTIRNRAGQLLSTLSPRTISDGVYEVSTIASQEGVHRAHAEATGRTRGAASIAYYVRPA